MKAAALLRLLDGDWVRGRDGRARKTLATPEQPAEQSKRVDPRLLQGPRQDGRPGPPSTASDQAGCDA